MIWYERSLIEFLNKTVSNTYFQNDSERTGRFPWQHKQTKELIRNTSSHAWTWESCPIFYLVSGKDRPGGPQGGIPVQFLTYFDGCLTFRHACKPVRAERACLHCCASSANVTAVWVDLLWGEGENAIWTTIWIRFVFIFVSIEDQSILL